MIGSPDLVAFTKDTYFKEISPDPLTLPEEFSVPLYPCTGSSTPWAKILDTNFKNDFILLAEFSEQVGPQPLLTVPPGTKACGTFDLNYFSLRIMSVDYQSSLTGPSSSGSPKLNFVEDSQVVLGDSKEGAFAYVHHLTLYDLEARGFVRPLCLAYVSSDENKILQQFELLSAEFSRVSECLKTGNRKNFAVELENKIRSLERERVELLKDIGKEDKVKIYGENSKLNGNCALDQDVEDGMMKEKTPDERNGCEILNVSEPDETCSRLQNDGDIASRKTCAIADNEVHRTVFKYNNHEKNQEELCPVPLASKAEGLEKRIREYKGLLKQVTSYLTRKLRDSEYSPYEPEDLPQTLEFEWDELKEGHLAGPMEEPSVFNEPTEPQTPNYNNAATCQFDKRLKTLEELCNTYFHQQALQQLHSIERSFRGDACYLYTQNRCHRLLRNLRATNFLFEDPYRSEEEDSQIGSTGHRSFQQASLLALSNEPISLESYASCVEMVPIKLECIERLTASSYFTTESSSQNHPFPDFHTSISPTETLVQIKSKETFKKVADECSSVVDCSSALMKSSISSGESIEVLGTEKSFRTQNSSSPVETDFQRSPITPAAVNGQKQRRVTTKRMYSEDSIEVLSTTESIIPEDLRAFTCVIDEECLDQDSCEKDRTESQVGNSAYKMGKPEEHENGCIEEPKSSCPIIRISPPDNPSLLQTSMEDTRQRTESIPFSFLEEPSHSAGDDLSECFSYQSNTTSTASDCTLSSCLHGDKRLSGTRKRQRRGRIGRAALQFLRQFPFAVQAVFSLLSGRTLVVVGSEEATVKQLVTALSIYTPNLGKYRESVQPWTSAPLQLTDLLKWKLIGFNRTCSQTPGLPHSLGHFNRYIGILDVDQKTLRCPVYSGSLLNQLVAPMNHITRGNTYFWLAQSVLNQLVNKAFLLTFSHRLHTLRSQHNAQEVALLSDLHDDDVKILDYLSELIKLQFLDVPPNVLRFGYTTSSVFKL